MWFLGKPRPRSARAERNSSSVSASMAVVVMFIKLILRLKGGLMSPNVSMFLNPKSVAYLAKNAIEMC